MPQQPALKQNTGSRKSETIAMKKIMDRCDEWIGVQPLENRVLLSSTLIDTDYHDDGGEQPHVLPELVLDQAGESGDGSSPSSAPLAPLADTFKLHSNTGADHTIYLDFDGHTTSNTIWNSNFNNNNPIVSGAYDFDGDALSFSTAELERIQYIWQRVSEDFIPFDVNVTTEDPGTAALIKSGGGDSQWGVRVVISGSSYDWYGAGAGGVAYPGSFNWNSDTPTFVFPDQLGNGHEKYTAEAVTHEAGHTVGLYHDGRTVPKEGYYQGHGSGDTGWAPIMGVGYYQNLTQWSKGEYDNADNTEDDLAIITSQNGFGYRTDDHGDSNGSASSLSMNGTSVSGDGIIETNTDYDVFSFTSGSGSISLNIDPFDRGPNLDILAELYDSSNNLIASSNPLSLLNADINTSVAGGTYYLHVSGTGKGDPLVDGYSDYGSLGQYTISGTVVDNGGQPSVSINDASASEDGSLVFTVSLSEPATEDVVITYATQDGTAQGSTAGTDYWTTSGTLTIFEGQTFKYVTITLQDDTEFEGNENLFVNLTSATGAVIADGQGEGTIIDNDAEPLPTISINDASVNEGKLNTKGRNKGQPQITDMTFTVSLSSAYSQTVTVQYATTDGTATAANNDYQSASGAVTFNPGETSKTVTVSIVGDNDAESDETFTVALSSPTNAVIADGTGTGTILDDDTGSGGGGGGGGGNGNGRGKNKAAVYNGAFADYTLNNLYQQMNEARTVMLLDADDDSDDGIVSIFDFLS